MIVKGVEARAILDSRKEQTIEIKIFTDYGEFSASAPNGKSTGKREAKSYKKSLEGDIKAMEDFSEYFSKEIIERIEDLRRIEDIVDGHVGANTLFVLESAVLKALAKEKNLEVWQLINPQARKMPRLLGNSVGGGKHSHNGKRPDFQEFLISPNEGSIEKDFKKNIELKKEIGERLKERDGSFKGRKNDENAWETTLNEKEVLEILKRESVDVGLDVACSSFYKRKKYHYENPRLDRTVDEQALYVGNMIKNFNLIYVEDPFDEEDFESFAKLHSKFPNCLVAGDDLTVTNYKRLKKAIENKSINGIIVKPNQNGSLLEVKRVCELARENGIKIIFSHRSGETEENILADLAFGFGADFFKCGIDGREREAKLKRLIEIEKSL